MNNEMVWVKVMSKAKSKEHVNRRNAVNIRTIMMMLVIKRRFLDNAKLNIKMPRVSTSQVQWLNDREN